MFGFNLEKLANFIGKHALTLQAYAAVKFADACLRALRGDAGVIECAFVSSQARHSSFTGVDFLTDLI